MNRRTDQQLLREYTGDRSEAAFAELVRRHVDLVYSAARRMVRDPHLAEDVTQGVFVALAQNAGPLTDRAVLTGWLHRTAQNLAANTVRSEVRRRVREQEAAAMHELFSNEPDADWEHIAPHLDHALGELTEPDRDALLLRYFERQSAREMAQTLGLSEDAAQRRVSRAVERLREFLSKRGVAAGATGLVLAVSASAVQAAPVGLAATITGASLAGAAGGTGTRLALLKFGAPAKLKAAIIGGIIVIGAATPLLVRHNKSSPLEEFQRFANGQVPIKEAVVYRKISRADGMLVNQEWVRFGFQDDTWYGQRVAPDANDASKMVPIPGNDVCGASFNQLWTISDKNLHLADKNFASGGVPDKVGAFTRDFMFQSLALGIPIVGREKIHWDGLAFTTSVSRGNVVLGTNGAPVSIEFSRSDKFPGAGIRYDYGMSTKGIPAAFTKTLNTTNPYVFRCEFLSLTLGKVDLAEGYVPIMFGDPSLRRTTTVWTNTLPYTVRKNKTYPAFERDGPLRPSPDVAQDNAAVPAVEPENTRPMAPERTALKKIWLLGLAGLVVAVIVVLARWHQCWRKETK